MLAQAPHSASRLGDALAVAARRYLDMGISLRVCDFARGDDGRARPVPGTDRELLKVGGRWDRRRRRWAGESTKPLVLRLHRGQERAGRWLVEWLRRWVSGDWTGFRRVWSMLMIGGRRSGKTHLACVAKVIFAVLCPGARLWAVSPTLETGNELDDNFREIIPRQWYVRKQAKTGRSTTFQLANGSRILLKSALKSERLKAGRVDLVLMNEAQEQSARAYAKLRAAIADVGGLLLLTANPPEAEGGRWIEDHYNRARAGEIEAEAFELDPRNNPIINYAALQAIADEVDSKTYERDVLGLFPPIGDVVMHAWSDKENWIDVPADFIDVTAEVTRAELGVAKPNIVGCDFQQTPAMAARVMRAYRDPKNMSTLHLWVIDEVDVKGNEDDLIDGLEAKGYAGADCAVIMDASAWYQDGAHNPGKTSDRKFRDRRWAHLYKPQKGSDRNPDVGERVKSGNAAAGTRSGRRRLFVARHCIATAEAMRRYENVHGKPNRRSRYAHAWDCVTYVIYRLFGVPKVTTSDFAFTSVKRFARDQHADT